MGSPNILLIAIIMELEVKGLKDTMDGMWKLSAGTVHGAQRMVKTTTELIAQGMRERAPVWKGSLEKSITAEFSRRGDTFFGVAKTGVHWAAPQEFGTGAAGPSGKSYFPNVTNLEEWALDKGIENVWALAMSIEARGTPPTKYTQKTIQDVAGDAIDRGFYAFLQEIKP